MLPDYFAIIGAVIISIGGLIYLYETIKGTVKPNRITWLLWGVLPMITFVAQRVQGVESISWVSFAAGFMPFLVFLASFVNKKSYWKTVPVDYACMVLAVIGIVLWCVTNDPNLAIIFSMLADFSAGFPTLKKAFLQPATESWSAYAISVFGLIISEASIHQWDFANYGFASYLIFMNALLAALAFRGRRPRIVA